MSQPARRPRRRRNRIVSPLRWLLTACAGILCAYALFELGVKAAYPYTLGDQQAKKVADLKNTLALQTARNADLYKDFDYLASDEGAETLARRQGYHLPGEQVYFLTPHETP